MRTCGGGGGGDVFFVLVFRIWLISCLRGVGVVQGKSQTVREPMGFLLKMRVSGEGHLVLGRRLFVGESFFFAH